METVKSRLLAFLESQRISKSEFSRRMGLSNAYLGSMRKSMPEDKVSRLVELFPQLNRDWLLYGEGEMLNKAERQTSASVRRQYMVPLLPIEAYAGCFTMGSDGVMPFECEMIPSTVQADFAINVTGDSMLPKIEPGTTLFIRRIHDGTFLPYGTEMVIDTENGVYLKVVNPSEKGDEYISAESYNPAYPPYQIPKSTIYGIYRIVAKTVGPGLI